jgi:cytochrome c-type biogenesis protein CcmI
VVIWFAAMLLIAAVGLFIAAPLSDQASGGPRSAISDESKRREHEHALAVQGLRELEFDQAMGKVDAGDYRVLRSKLENRALAALSAGDKADRQSARDRLATVAALSEPIAAARTAILNFCPQCGSRVDSAHHFCASCGAALAVTAAAAKMK